jgi:hypothetical protein
MRKQDELLVERVGGLAGFGGPGSHLSSKGGLLMSELNPEEKDAVERLFAGAKSSVKPTPDAFRYRLTRKIGNRSRTVEVAEEDVPLSIRKCVKDTLD